MNKPDVSNLMNEIIKSTPEQALKDYFASFAAPLLLYKQGEYWVGDTEVPIGTRFVVRILDHRVGWVRWENDMPIESVMGFLHQGYCAPSRNDLGHFDESVWAKDKDGNPRDPWQQSDTIPFVADDGEEFLFSTQSYGGRHVLYKLEKAFSKEKKSGDPVIELGSERVRNEKKKISYDRPVFTVVGWVTPTIAEPKQTALPPAKKSAAEIIGEAATEELPF